MALVGVMVPPPTGQFDDIHALAAFAAADREASPEPRLFLPPLWQLAVQP